jgi:hypothetical protein
MALNMKTAISFFLLLCLIVTFTGCNKTVKYLTFNMKAGDIRQNYLKHPFYSFEYPETYYLVDLNKPSFDPSFPATQDASDLECTYYTDSAVSRMGVRVEKPGLFYNDSKEKFGAFVSTANQTGHDTVIKKVVVFGVTADYIAYYSRGMEDLPQYSPDTQSSYRAVIFDYDGLIWTIVMLSTYNGSEPLEYKTYFDHIISSFKINN